MIENLYIFLKDFGIPISFTLANGTIINKDANGEQLLGIFDKTYADSSMGYMKTKTDKPTLTCVEADVVQIERGASVEIKGTTYNVMSNDDDGTGMSTIELAKQ